ncbi:MAG: serine protease Do [Patescibacteria group bacterium]|nr:serine protease Do [Patescibacteria group bacterium]
MCNSLFKYHRILIIPLIAISILLGAGCAKEVRTPVQNPDARLSYIPKARSADLEIEIRQYFNLIDLKRFEEAYKKLSLNFQLQHTLSEWSDGYKNTISHTINSVTCRDASCEVDLVATEIRDETIIKTRYLFEYTFLISVGSKPLIEKGSLIRSNDEERVRIQTPTVRGWETIARSSVQILCNNDQDQDSLSSGSGTILHEDGIILSNAHVKSSSDDQCLVFMVSGQGILQVDNFFQVKQTLLLDETRDRWIFQIHNADDQKFPYIPVPPCTKEQPSISDGIRIYGFPWRAGGGNLVVTEGIISGVNRIRGSYITSAKVDHGNSGGAAINTAKDCFLGIPTFITGESEVYGQIVDIADIRQEYPELFSALYTKKN